MNAMTRILRKTRGQFQQRQLAKPEPGERERGGVPAPGGAWTALCPAREEMFDLRRDVMQSTA